MNLKNEIVFNDGFSKTFAKLFKLAFPATISLQLVATLKALGEQQKNVFAVRDKLLERLASKNEKGTVLYKNNIAEFPTDEAKQEFYSEMDSLLNLEFEIPLKAKLRLDDKIQISAEEIIILQPIIDIDI